MHPEIMRELGAQRTRDLRERAQRAGLARTAHRGLRALRRDARRAAEFVVPAVPDYVDGSFRAEADSRVPAGRHTA